MFNISLSSECPLASTPAPVSPSISCRILPNCTSIDCCVEVGFLANRSINILVSMDPCTSVLSLNIEKLQHKVTLYNYQFGKPDNFTLQGSIRIE